MKTSELTGALLDCWVARARGIDPKNIRIAPLIFGSGAEPMCQVLTGFDDDPGAFAFRPFQPSTSWAQGGPIIEREKMTVEPFGDGWGAGIGDVYTKWYLEGPTLLVAAMRAYVASEFGDEVPDDPTVKADRKRNG